MLFVLEEMLASRVRGPGCAIAFGPGLAIESMLFEGLGDRSERRSSRARADGQRGESIPPAFEACLRDLARINRWTGAYRITLAGSSAARSAWADRPLVVVDVGSGYGDMLRRIAIFAEQRGVAVDLIGVDLNPLAATTAARATPPGPPIRYLTARCLRAVAVAPAGRCDQLLVRPSSR